MGGLTASILIRAASIIYCRSPSFTQLLPDFTDQLQRSLTNSTTGIVKYYYSVRACVAPLAPAMHVKIIYIYT